MARQGRVEITKEFIHVSLQAAPDRTLFQTQQDGKTFLSLLEEVCAAYHWRCYAYLLMPQSYELLIQMDEPLLSRGMRQISSVYGQAYNKRYGQKGRVFQQRFKSLYVESGTPLKDLLVSLYQKPVQQGYVSQAEQWLGSSLRLHLGKEASSWVDEELLFLFGETKKEAQKNLTEKVQSMQSVPSSQRQLYYGSANYGRKILRAKERLKPLPQKRVLSYYKNSCSSPKEAIVEACLSGLYPQQKVADYFDVSAAQVSRLLKIERTKRNNAK